MAKRKLRIGMIGAGGISNVHCQGWAKLGDCKLVAITDINPEAAKKRAEEFHIPAIDADPASLIRRKDLDVIDIVTPNRFHKAQTVAALLAGKHVICEKPLALTMAEVDAMIAASRKGKRKLMCAQHMRYQDDTQTLREYLQKNSLGDVYYARAWYLRRRGIPSTPGFIYKKNSGGGCLIDVGVHILDLTMFMMDNFKPVSVTGIGGKMLCGRKDTWSEWGKLDNKGMDVEDFAAGMIRFASGAAMSLECSFALNMKPRWEVRLDLFGTEAGASWPSGDIVAHTSRGFVNTGLTWREGGEEPHRAIIAAFARAVADNKPVPVPPEQTRAVISVLEGLYKSMETGREVRL